jgi:hypothetical protein
MPTRTFCLFSAAVCLLLAGCGGSSGPQRGAVSGSVTLGGELVARGNINFVPIRDTKGPVVGGRINDGRYTLSRSEGPIVGWNRIEISWSRATGRQVPAGSPYPAGTMVDEITEAIPAQYNVSSTLEEEIEAKKNVLDFELATE